MRFGVCCNQQQFKTVKKAGFSYVETEFYKLASMEQSEYDAFLSELRACGLESEACNCFFNIKTPLIGEKVDHSFLPEYVRKGMERAAGAGCRVVVFGSGSIRRIPEGFPRERAAEQLCSILGVCGDIAAAYGINIALEPLRAKETNFINTVAEGLELTAQLKHPHVGVLADFFHISQSGESLDAVKNAGEKLFHVHLARANNDRAMPVTPEDLDFCRQWAAALKAGGYNGRCSLEGVFSPDFETALAAVKPALAIFEE